MLVAHQTQHQSYDEEKKGGGYDPYGSDPKNDRKSSGESSIYNVVDDKAEPSGGSGKDFQSALLQSTQTD